MVLCNAAFWVTSEVFRSLLGIKTGNREKNRRKERIQVEFKEFPSGNRDKYILKLLSHVSMERNLMKGYGRI